MRKLVPAAAAVACSIVIVFAGSASAGSDPAETKVTIKGESGDYFGSVKSPKPNRCADDRKVALFKKKPGADEKIATDNASREGDRYKWSTGNTGSDGRHYARVRKIPGCLGDKSETIE